VENEIISKRERERVMHMREWGNRKSDCEILKHKHRGTIQERECAEGVDELESGE